MTHYSTQAGGGQCFRNAYLPVNPGLQKLLIGRVVPVLCVIPDSYLGVGVGGEGALQVSGSGFMKFLSCFDYSCKLQCSVWENMQLKINV